MLAERNERTRRPVERRRSQVWSWAGTAMTKCKLECWHRSLCLCIAHPQGAGNSAVHRAPSAGGAWCCLFGDQGRLISPGALDGGGPGPEAVAGGAGGLAAGRASRGCSCRAAPGRQGAQRCDGRPAWLEGGAGGCCAGGGGGQRPGADGRLLLGGPRGRCLL